MSKITPKNLHYDDTLPPFLQRLRANQPARETFQASRPSKPRTAAEEEEDEPVVFDEGSGETLSKTEWEAREAAEKEGEDEGGVEAKEGKAEGEGDKEKIAAIGGGRKRKIGKVVGGDEEVEVQSKPGKKIAKSEGNKKGEKEKEKSKAPHKKKAKKVMLSFGDDE